MYIYIYIYIIYIYIYIYIVILYNIIYIYIYINIKWTMPASALRAYGHIPWEKTQSKVVRLERESI